MDADDATVIAIGGNLDLQGATVQAVLDAALERFPAEGLQILRRSRWWCSKAWPDPTEPPYLNGVVLVRTSLSARDVLQALLRIEASLGRRRGEPNAPRTLDLDLIAHARDVIDEPDLVLPHPRAADRRFVMGPLAEISPEWRHPVLGETAEVLAARSTVGKDAQPLASDGK